jgi:hypothetical protein
MLTRRDFIHSGCVAGAISLSPNFLDRAGAVLDGHGSAALPDSTGKALINGFHGTDFPFKNLIKMAGVINSTGGNVDRDSYPVAGRNIGLAITLPTAYTGRYRLLHSGATAFFSNTPGLVHVYNGGRNVFGVSRANSGYNAGNFATFGSPVNVEFDFSRSIKGAADNGSGAIRLSFADTSNFPNCRVFVRDVVGVPNSNNTADTSWAYTIIDGSHVDLIGSTFSGSYVSGGSFVFLQSSINVTFTNYAGSGVPSDLILCRSSAPYTGDIAAIQGGVLSQQFNDDFIAKLQSLNAHAVRMMDVSAVNGSMITRSKYQSSVSSITYEAFTSPPDTWVSGGIVSNSGQLYTCSASTDTPVNWTDGEMFQGTMANAPVPVSIASASASPVSNGLGGHLVRLTVQSPASTSGFPSKVSVFAGGYSGTWSINVINSTQFDLVSDPGGNPSTFTVTTTGAVNIATINCASRGAKIMTNSWGSPFQTFSGLPPSGVCTFVYDAVMDVVMVLASLTFAAWPVAVRVALCNKLNQNYYHNFPAMYDLPSIATETAYIRDNLNSNLKCYAELGNEIWNGAFTQSQFFNNRSLALNLGGTAGYAGLRNRQVFGQMTTTWRARTGLNRVATWQNVNFPSGAQDALLLGTGLVASNARYLAFVGGVDPGYTFSPNRPVDFYDQLSPAPYFNGMLGEGGIYSPGMGTINSTDIARMTAAADNFALGTAPGIAAAFAWIDNDIKQGTIQTQAITSVAASVFTINGHGFGNGSQVMFSTATGTLYSGLSATTRYFIVNITTNTFQVSATLGGSPITISGGSGTIFIGILLDLSLLYQKLNCYPTWVTAATTYNKGLISYEGGLNSSTITQAQCTSFGISTSYGGTGNTFGVSGGLVYIMLIAYKFDAMFKALVLQQFNDEVAAFANSIPGWYTFGGNATGDVPSYPWSLESTDLYGPFFRSFDAMQQFNQ